MVTLELQETLDLRCVLTVHRKLFHTEFQGMMGDEGPTGLPGDMGDMGSTGESVRTNVCHIYSIHISKLV